MFMKNRQNVTHNASKHVVRGLALALLLSSPAAATFSLDNPANGGFSSGATVVFGWACDATTVEIALGGSNEKFERFTLPYGAYRADTIGPCQNKGYNGFAAFWNLNRLGTGPAQATLIIDGVEVETYNFDVTRPTQKDRNTQLSGRTSLIPNFPDANEQIDVIWETITQNFTLASSNAPTVPSPTDPCRTSKTKCSLESPAPSQLASGSYPLVGWACEATRVHMVLEHENGNSETVDLPYGAARDDTRETCNNLGRNGFGAVTNLNRLGTGTVTATLYIDDQWAAERKFWVTKPTDQNRYTGPVSEYEVPAFPSASQTTTLVWQEPLQNFAIKEVTPPDETFFRCDATVNSSFADCIDAAESQGCFQPECTVLLLATDDPPFYLDRQYPLPANMKITGDTQGTDCYAEPEKCNCYADPDNCALKTWIVATRAVNNGCGSLDPNPGDPSSRIGFILNDYTWIGNLKYKSLDTQRWQASGQPLCGGGVFETPGCTDAYCISPERIRNRDGKFDGAHHATVDSVYVTGDGTDPTHPDAPLTAPQLAAFVTQTPNLGLPSHDLLFRNVQLNKSWADGINIHGSTYNTRLEYCSIGYNGDDNIGLWSAPGPQRLRNITLYDNTLSQERTTNAGPWGNCVAIYGGGGAGPNRIWIDRNKCTPRSDLPAPVKISTQFGDLANSAQSKQEMFGYDSEIYVLNTPGPDRCMGGIYDAPQVEGLPYKARINGCPDTSGWPTCPDPAFIRNDCPDGKASWNEKGPWGPAWYCDEGQPPLWGSLATACIHNDCKSIKYFPEYDMWICEDDLIYDSCRIKSGCWCNEEPCENVKYEPDNARWVCTLPLPNWNGDYDACIVPRGACQNGLKYYVDGRFDSHWSCY